MGNVSKNDVEWLLTLHQKKPNRTSRKKSYSSLKKTFLWALIIFFGMIALGGGVFVSILLLLVYILFLFKKLKDHKRRFKYSVYSAGVMVFGFCLFSLFYLSGVNAKRPEIREVYRSMHPILRVAISSVTLADGDLVITDIERVSSDYNAMGLPVNPNSLHYIQDQTGYVHAVDLRTMDQSMVRNYLLQFSLEVMGFETLRHVGTADHLHVELPVNGK